MGTYVKSPSKGNGPGRGISFPCGEKKGDAGKKKRGRGSRGYLTKGGGGSLPKKIIGG